MTGFLYIHDIIKKTLSNGPYERYCIWFQGCIRRCLGCFNPKTHDLENGKKIKILTLINDILKIKENIEGITISGGEPLLQIKGLINLLMEIRKKTNLGIILLTGFEKNELISLKEYKTLVKLIDCIVYGPFVLEKKVNYGLVGSSNKRFIFSTERYTKEQITSSPISELIIDSNGDIYISGVKPSIFLKGYLK